MEVERRKIAGLAFHALGRADWPGGDTLVDHPHRHRTGRGRSREHQRAVRLRWAPLERLDLPVERLDSDRLVMPGAGRYRFAFGDVVLEIDAMTGARIGTLTLAGTNIIVPATAAARVDGGMDNTTWGSVFWTSPRSSWPPPMWPPPVAIDNAPYTTGGISGTHVVLTGPTETTLGVNMKKDVSADATSGWIKLAYTINATKSLKAGPWEISRVPRGGIVFFPYTGTVTNQVPLTITQSGGILWFNDAAMTATSPNGDKLFADGMTKYGTSTTPKSMTETQCGCDRRLIARASISKRFRNCSEAATSLWRNLIATIRCSPTRSPR